MAAYDSIMHNHPHAWIRRLICILLLTATSTLWAESWPAWRGNVSGSGVAVGRDAPRQWGVDSQVRWRVALPERGNSTPVVWGDRVFVTQAVSASNWRGLMCFDRANGKLLWKQGVTYDKPERTHQANPYCSASPATDGQRVVASYGSAGVVCYDMQGRELWRRDFGPVDHIWGNSSSPVLHGDLCYHYHGPGEGGFLVALDAKTGNTVWRFDEPAWDTDERTDNFRGQPGKGVTGSFSTPIIVNAGERTELIMSFPMELRALDPESGKTLWRCEGLNPLVYTSPVHADGIVVAMGGYAGTSIGVKVGGTGDVAATHRLWQLERHNGGIGSGVIKDGHLYYDNSGGIAFCLDIATGRTLWKARLPGQGKSWGSFVLIGDYIYTLSQTGETVIFKADPAGLDVAAHNKIGEMTNSSLVPSSSEIFIRTHEALWCIGSPAAP